MTNHAAKDSASVTPPSAAKELVAKVYDLISAGRASEARACFPQLEQLGRSEEPAPRLIAGAAFIDIGQDLDDSDLVRRGISLLRDVDIAEVQERARPAYWYNLGNGYAGLYHARRIAASVQRALDEDFRGAKHCYQKAISAGPSSPETRARLCTNYGILLRTVGRHIEAIEAYDEALSAVPDHAMALWHKSRDLRWYSNLVERPTKRSARLEAWHLLKRSLEAGLDPGHRAKA